MLYIIAFVCGALCAALAAVLLLSKWQREEEKIRTECRAAECKTKALLDNIERYDGSARGQRVIK